MENLEQKMIYQYGKSNQEGFTLLEIVVALTIFAVAFAVLIKIQSNNISHIRNSFEKLEAIKFFKEQIYTIPQRETSEDQFSWKEERKRIEFGIKEIRYKIIDRGTGKEILEIKTYER